MKLKEFVKNFNFDKPVWDNLPESFCNDDLTGLGSGEVGKYLAIKNLWELSQPKKPNSRSRIWKSTNGYIYLVAWSNASLLRVLVRKFTTALPKSEYRLKSQLDDATRSAVANIEEGFARATTRQYLDFLGYSQGSLKEVKGDIQRARQDGFLKSVSGSSLADLGIGLREWHEALKKSVISSKVLQSPLKSFKGEPFRFGYLSVDNLDPGSLTYEIFIEIVNKTDWHLRRLVESLEKKLNKENPPSLKLRRTQ